jgi:hypothetical protein
MGRSHRNEFYSYAWFGEGMDRNPILFLGPLVWPRLVGIRTPIPSPASHEFEPPPFLPYNSTPPSSRSFPPLLSLPSETAGRRLLPSLRNSSMLASLPSCCSCCNLGVASRGESTRRRSTWCWSHVVFGHTAAVRRNEEEGYKKRRRVGEGFCQVLQRFVVFPADCVFSQGNLELILRQMERILDRRIYR